MAFGDFVRSNEATGEPLGSTGPFDITLDLTGVDTVALLANSENIRNDTTPLAAVRDPAGDNESLTRIAGASNTYLDSASSRIVHDLLWLDVSAETGSQTFRVTSPGGDTWRYVIQIAGYEGVVDSVEAAVTDLSLSDSITTITDGALVVSWGGSSRGSPNTGELFAPSAPGGLTEREDQKLVVGGALGDFVQATAGSVTVTWTESSTSATLAIGAASFAPAATGTTEDMTGTSAGTSTDTADADIHVASVSTSAGTSTDTASISLIVNITGTSAGTSNDTAAATFPVTVEMTGTSAGTSADSAAASLLQALTGTSAGTSLDTAIYVDFDTVALAIGFLQIRVERLNRVLQPLGQRRRSFSGKMRLSIPAGDPWAVAWDLTTPLLPLADIEALEAALETPGIVTLNGTRVATDTAAIVASHSRVRTSEDGTEASLTAELWEVSPV